jgi:hypothetical protein
MFCHCRYDIDREGEPCENFKDKDDVVEVRHGEWVWKELFGEHGVMLCCSECLETEGARENANYCPNCGAKMDGKGEGE